jgi:hypothetical protein
MLKSINQEPVPQSPTLDRIIVEDSMNKATNDLLGEPLDGSSLKTTYTEATRVGYFMPKEPDAKVIDSMDYLSQRSNIYRYRHSSSQLSAFVSGICSQVIGMDLEKGFPRHKLIQAVALAHKEKDEDLMFDSNSQDGVPTHMPAWIFETKTSQWITNLAKNLQGKGNANTTIAELCNSGLISAKEVELLTKSPAVKRKLAALRRN